MSDSIVEEAKRNWLLTTTVYGPQQQREKQDLEFQIAERQWTFEAKQQRSAMQLGKMNLAARPTLSISKLNQPIQIVYNQFRAAHLGINVHPLSENADKETAEVIQGIYRKIERDSRADIARGWAFMRALEAGRGWYKVNVKYDEESGHPFDQKIVFERVLYQADVYPDPAATEPDWSDGQWLFHVRWVAREAFRREFPKATLAAANELVWANTALTAPQWVQGNGTGGEKDAVLVADYYCKKYEKQAIVQYADGSWSPADKPTKGLQVVRERERDIQTVWWYCLTGAEPEPLRSQQWNGKHIPYIPTIGNELQPFEGERIWQGIIAPAKDGQRFYNFAASSLAERMAMEPKAPFMLDPRQIEGFQGYYDQANVRNWPYLPYNAVMEGGGLIPPPQRTQVESTGMVISMQALQEADKFIQAATTIYDPLLGNFDPKQHSGKAIQAVQGQGDVSNSGYMQNFKTITMPYEALVTLDLMPPVYGERPGRLIEILTGEDKSKRVALNIPYTMGTDGQPQVNPQQAEGALEHNLADGIYGVAVTVERSYSTRMEEGLEKWTAILQTLPPEDAVVIVPIMMRFLTAPGSTEAAEKLQKVVDARFPFLQHTEGQKPTPEMLEGQNTALKAKIQELEQIAQQMNKELETDAAKQEAQREKTRTDAEVAARKNMADNETKMAIATQSNQTKLAIAELAAGQQDTALKVEMILGLLTQREKMAEEARLDDQEGSHQVGMEAMKQAGAREQRAHDKEMAAAGMGHDAGLTAAGMAHESAEGEAGREHETEQAKMAAKQTKGDD